MTVFNSLGSNYDLRTALQTLVASGGKGVRGQLTKLLSQRYGGSVVLTYKGRDALRLALEALPHKGKVVVNGYTCYAVFEAVAESGHAPLYLDIGDHSLNFPPESLERALTEHAGIVAVVVQNTLGFPCDIGPIEKLCEEHGIPLIEDLAHAIGTRYADGREAGTVGDFTALSFSQDKVIDAVSGGALIVRNGRYADRMPAPAVPVPISQQLKDRLYPILTWKIRTLYPLGLGKPFHALLRSSHLLSRPFDGFKSDVRILPDWYCGLITRQFQQLERTQAHRQRIARMYAERFGVCSPLPLKFDKTSAIRFPLLALDRDQLIEYLRKNGMYVSDIWYDAPISPQKYISHTNYRGECPHGERVADLMVNLPTHRNVSERAARRIADLASEWLQARNAGYHVAEVTSEAAWEAFITMRAPHSFLHSWTWGQLHAEEGVGVFRIGVYREQRLVAAALFLKIAARRGSFLLCPHGPLITPGNDEALLFEFIAEKAEALGAREKCAFIRICPLSPATEEPAQHYRSLGFRNAPIHMHPELAWMLDLTKSEDDLLKDMRKTTRYLIKQMERKGVEIAQSTDPGDIEKFWQVYQATVERQQFTPFRKEHLRREFELFAKDGHAAFFFGSYEGRTIAAAIIIFYNGQAFYHHSGSVPTFRDINASYLLQWRVIQEAKRRGCTLYNFWGISPEGRPEHPWAGLSLFKKGFGGFAESYLHAQDKPLTKQYWINYLVETMRRIKRGL